MRHVVMFSGGVGSWAAAKRVVAQHGVKGVVLLFADTLIEDEDLYRFLEEGSKNIGAPLVRIAEGRTPWQVYKDERFLGNSRVDPCSKLLKRKPSESWLRQNCIQQETTVYLGIDWTEAHRFERAKSSQEKQGWNYEAPLCDPPYLSRKQIFELLKAESIEPPRLYGLGFSHNNCGGFCCKAGQGHFANLLRHLPERFTAHEEEEQRVRRLLNRDVAMMVDRSGGGRRRPLTMRSLRLRIESGGEVDKHEVGGCGCMVEELASCGDPERD